MAQNEVGILYITCICCSIEMHIKSFKSSKDYLSLFNPVLGKFSSLRKLTEEVHIL